MKEINFNFDIYYYFTDIDNKADFDTLDIIGVIDWNIFVQLENLIGIKNYNNNV